MREKTIPVSLGGARWRVPDAKTYVEVAGKLLVWAAKSKSAEARSQFAFLADLYEELVERPVVEGAGEILLIVVRAVLVIDRRDDEAFARQVLADVAHQVAVARVTVRDDHEWERAVGRRGRRVANRLAVQRRHDRTDTAW